VRRAILPPSYERTLGHAQRIELASDRQIRARNKISYRLAHWPIWIFVFFIAPGPMTFNLFAHGVSRQMLIWLGVVLLGTGIAGLCGKLPGVEPQPYIIRFTEDRPNPLYRRICYTLAWSEAITFAVLNITGMLLAIVTGHWHLRQIYDAAYLAVDERRGPRAALFLRLDVGGVRRAARALGALEVSSRDARDRQFQARRVH
jgi:hypothetical protein